MTKSTMRQEAAGLLGEPSPARIQLRCIPNAANRRSTFKKRKAGLLKKASELSAMCGVEVCLFCTGHSDPQLEDSTDVRFSCSEPATSTVENIVNRYEAMPLEHRLKKSHDSVSHLESQIKRTEKEVENMMKLNSGLDEAVYRKLDPEIEFIRSIKLQVDAKILELIGQRDGGEGIISPGDQFINYPPDW